MQKHTLVYFAIGGRGEPIRLSFAIGGLPFTNKVMDFSDFKAAKPALPMGQLPTLEVEDESGKKKVLGQSNAMLRYVGQKAGLYPTEPMEALEVDMIVDTIEAAATLVSVTVAGPQSLYIADEPWPKEKVLEIRAKLLEPGNMNNVHYYLGILENILIANGSGWFVGDRPTIADTKAHHLVSWLIGGILDGISESCLDEFPLLKGIYAKIEALPQVVDFRNKHGKKYDTFDFVPPEN